MLPLDLTEEVTRRHPVVHIVLDLTAADHLTGFL